MHVWSSHKNAESKSLLMSFWLATCPEPEIWCGYIWFLFCKVLRLMRFIMSLGKASFMVYTESQLLLPKGSKICWNPLRFTVLRETKCDDRVMIVRRAHWCGSGQTSISGVRRGWPSSHVTWTRLTVPTTLTAFRIRWLCHLCSVLPPVSQKQSHVPHTPQPPESWWVQKDTVGEDYGGY